MGSQRVYVGTLDPTVSKEQLEDEVRQFGKINDIWVARNPAGFAFVTFEDTRDAEDCVRGLTGMQQSALMHRFNNWVSHMAVDKKVLDGRLRLVLLRQMGGAVVTGDFPRNVLDTTLSANYGAMTEHLGA